MKILSGFAVLILGAGISWGQDALKPLPPDGFVTLQEIVSDFSSNQAAALQKYNGMRITVYGRVGQVTQSEDEEGDPLVVFLQLPDNPTPDVKCVFNSAGVPQGGTVVVQTNNQEADFYRHRTNIWHDELMPSETPIDITGQMAGIVGTFDNFIAGDIVLRECRRLREQPLMQLLSQHGLAGQ